MIKLTITCENEEVETILRLLERPGRSVAERIEILRAAQAWLIASDNHDYTCPDHNELSSVFEFVGTDLPA